MSSNLNICWNLVIYRIYICAYVCIHIKNTRFSWMRGITSGFAYVQILSCKAKTTHHVVWSFWLQDSYARQITNPSFLDINRDGYEVAIWPWFVFLGGAMGCLISSALSHLFACHSLRYNLFFWRLDYAGISLMIVCSFFCPIYYIFCDQPYWCIFYLSTITIFGILAIITLLSPALFSGRFRSFRVTLFLAMGFSGLIPATHALFLHSGHPQVLVALGYEIIMAILYAIGAVFYMTRFPERCKPGAFDLVGHSHQIFHVFVVAAALAHCVASLVVMDWRRGCATLQWRYDGVDTAAKGSETSTFCLHY